MTSKRPLFRYWTMGVALLIMAGPAIVFAVLKALGLLHVASLPMWLLNAAGNVTGKGAAGGAGAAAAGTAAAKGSKITDPSLSRSDGRDHPGSYTPTPGYQGPPIDDPALKEAQDQALRNNPALRGSHSDPPPNLVGDIYHGLQKGLQQMH
ncbi:MAG TPA: hypothetical protein VEI54_00315 [Candidatus Limnocylindrales bacterium]|nr:hypothetical protein [Candidatus Limnocylindrales bacterium]